MPLAPKRYTPPGHTRAKREKGWASRRAEYRAWYNLWVWRKPGGIRDQVLSRDPLCVDCKAKGILTPATEADHEIPHKGDWDKFIDMDNIRGRCKACHSRKTKSEGTGG